MKYWSKELDKACFQYDMVYEDFEDLTSRTASEKILRDKAFNIAKNQKYDGYQRDIASMIYKFFDKETSDSSVKNENMSNKELAEELHNFIRKFLKKERYTHLLLTILGRWSGRLQLISKFNKRIRFLTMFYWYF